MLDFQIWNDLFKDENMVHLCVPSHFWQVEKFTKNTFSTMATFFHEKLNPLSDPF